MINFSVLNWWTGAVKFTAKIDCAEDAPTSIKLGLAVRWAVSTRANLTGADLTDADLTRAHLTYADLTGANLTDADLESVRVDLFDVLLRAMPEVPGLLAALRAGKIDGSTYTGTCACLCGTIANVRHVDVDTLTFRDADRPAERWFMGIKPGQTPDNHSVSKITEGWMLEFMSLVGIADADVEQSAEAIA